MTEEAKMDMGEDLGQKDIIDREIQEAANQSENDINREIREEARKDSDIEQVVNAAPEKKEVLSNGITKILKDKISSLLTSVGQTSASAIGTGKEYGMEILSRGADTGKQYAKKALDVTADKGKQYALGVLDYASQKGKEYGKLFLTYLFENIEEGKQGAKEKLYEFFTDIKKKIIKKLFTKKNYIKTLFKERLGSLEYDQTLRELENDANEASEVLMEIKTKEYFLWKLFYGITMTPDNVIYLSIEKDSDEDEFLKKINKKYQEINPDDEIVSIINFRSRADFIADINKMFIDYYSVLRREQEPITTEMRIMFFIDLVCPENGGDPSYDYEPDPSNLNSYEDCENIINTNCRFGQEISDIDRSNFQKLLDDSSRLKELKQNPSQNKAEIKALEQKMDKYMQESNIEIGKGVPGKQTEILQTINKRLKQINKSFINVLNNFEKEKKKGTLTIKDIIRYQDDLKQVKNALYTFMEAIKRNSGTDIQKLSTLALSNEEIERTADFYKGQSAALNARHDQIEQLIGEMENYKRLMQIDPLYNESIAEGKRHDDLDNKRGREDAKTATPAAKRGRVRGGKKQKTVMKGGKKQKKRTIKKGGKKQLKKTAKRRKQFTKRR